MIAAGRSWSGQERNCCLLNTRDGRFANISAISGLDFADDARGAAVVDWDHDGDLDVWFTNRTAPQVRFLENRFRGSANYLSLRLVGVACNRDAIGARVEIELAGNDAAAPDRLVRTVAAGSGYLSQSSKSLHFGLGHGRSIDRVRIQWPGGQAQELVEIEPNQHYEIVQGQHAVPWSRPGADALASSRIENQTNAVAPTVVPTRTARVVLSERYPLFADLAFTASDGQPQTLAKLRGQPVLLTLFATWCAPCLKELAEFSPAAERIRSSGASLLALSIEQVDGRATPAEVAATLERVRFTGEWGLASEQLLETFQSIENELFFISQPLPLPVSYLIDGDGQIAVIYRGPVGTDQWLQDVAGLRDPVGAGQNLAFSGGVWIVPPRGYRANDHQRIGHLFAQRGDFAEAEASYRRAAQLRPDFAAWNNLATVLASQGQVDRAIPFLQRAIQLKPDSVPTHYNLAVILAQQGRLSESRYHFQRALEIEPDFQPALDRLRELPTNTPVKPPANVRQND
jgi:tetratricopeptide (TPR) repeat protein